MKFSTSTILILLLAVSTPVSLWAHGGHQDGILEMADVDLPELSDESIGEETVGEETFGMEETVVTDPDDSGPVDYGMGDMPADTPETKGAPPLWGEQPPPVGAEPVAPMDLSNMSEHDDHDMPASDHASMKMESVKPAEHEWISSSRKGYAWAIALVVLSCLWFGFLDMKRPFE